MTTWEKRVVELGLTMMRLNVKEEKIAVLIKDAESIEECFAHNTIWVETGDVNMRQYLPRA